MTTSPVEFQLVYRNMGLAPYTHTTQGVEKDPLQCTVLVIIWSSLATVTFCWNSYYKPTHRLPDLTCKNIGLEYDLYILLNPGLHAPNYWSHSKWSVGNVRRFSGHFKELFLETLSVRLLHELYKHCFNLYSHNKQVKCSFESFLALVFKLYKKNNASHKFTKSLLTSIQY